MYPNQIVHFEIKLIVYLHINNNNNNEFDIMVVLAIMK